MFDLINTPAASAQATDLAGFLDGLDGLDGILEDFLD